MTRRTREVQHNQLLDKKLQNKNLSHSRDNSFANGQSQTQLLVNKLLHQSDRTARRTTREEEGGEEDEDELTGRTKVDKIVGEVITRAK